MRFLRKFFDKQARHFSEEGKLHKLSPLFDAVDTLVFTPGKVTKNAPFIRDAIDLKRIMSTVALALLPAVIMALYNTGYQANLILERSGSIFANIVHGALYFLPVYLVTLVVGGFWEVLFAVVRKHEIAEGFFVTGLLFPLILPPTIPLWQVALGISFGVVFGKEVFGGVGMNFLNPALTGRIFLFFAYPAYITGDAVWVAVDGVGKATPLAELADSSVELSVSFIDAFLGFMPGSMGETSTLACLLGAFILIVTGLASWRIMISTLAGMVCLSLFFNLFVHSTTNPMFEVSPLWHLVLGGFAFGTVYMATDPVSAAVTRGGQYIYGLLIGFLVVLIRVLNPAFPEGMMLAILFGNVFAPTIDKIFIKKNIKRRKLRSGS
ncbi:MAG: NADH:ubiquinone reductase (Na(+)-transporting) subunit B [Candidatus Aminicenantes bacterium]|nr:NADH:ubiquinone reductase (Na(+)-transporting) subunit B [Candidatus Aminicenantes bacterium]